MLSLLVLTSDDWPLWRAARLAALADAPDAFKSRLADWGSGGEEEWRARLAIPGAHNVVAVLDGRPVGLASGVPGDDGVSELRSVWVSPDVRGRGLASRLIGAVETWAREAGATALQLGVLEGNDAALLLYRRNGFVATGELDANGERVMLKPLHWPSGK